MIYNTTGLRGSVKKSVYYLFIGKGKKVAGEDGFDPVRSSFPPENFLDYPGAR